MGEELKILLEQMLKNINELNQKFSAFEEFMHFTKEKQSNLQRWKDRSFTVIATLLGTNVVLDILINHLRVLHV